MKLDVLGSVLCAQCPAACCRYVALPLDKPRTVRDYDDIRWYLMHEGFSVFVEDGDWYVQIESKCKNLRDDNLCGVYETRPQICESYQPGDCDYLGGDYGYDHLFTHPSQLEAYVERKLGRRLGDRSGGTPSAPTRRRVTPVNGRTPRRTSTDAQTVAERRRPSR
ncbi:MAG: hypothetical protein BroJett003_12050 [Planctomycetota bacterium]|nr:MAG: hypothetical protein BroJett003_12050 [Planctomycetota bacterium]